MGAIGALVLARARARADMWALVALGVAIATAVPVFASASTVVASAGALEHGLAELPAGRRSVTVSYNGDLVGQDLAKADRSVRGQLRGLSGVAPLRQVAFRRMSDGQGSEFTLAAVDELARVVRLTSGRMPSSCAPTRCEVVQVGRQPTPATARIGVVLVGRAERTNQLVLSGTFDPGAGTAILLGADTQQLAAVAVLDLFLHTWGWVAPIDAGVVAQVGVDRYLTRESDVADSLNRAVPGLVLTAPGDVLRAEDARARRSGSRFALLGGTSAALVLGMAVVAAVSVRQDHLAVVRLLRTRGGTRRRLAAFSATEATWPCLVGAVVGAATSYCVAWWAWGQPAAHAGLSGGVLTALILTVVAALVVGSVLRWLPATDERGPWRTVTAVAVATVAAAVLGASRGSTNVDPGAPADPLVSLLPVLTAVAGGLLAARAWPVIPRVLVWLLPLRASGARLALAGAVRQPLRAAATVGVLAATCCSVVFAGTYRATVDRGAADQAAFAVPMVARLTTGPTLTRPADLATPEAVAATAPGAVAYPVLRTGATIGLSPAESAPVEMLGLNPAALPRIAHWRPDYSGTAPATIARRLMTAPPVSGTSIPDAARRLTVPVSGSTFRLDAIALIRDSSGRSSPITLTRRGDTLGGNLPAAAGRELVSLTLREDQQTATLRLHASGEGEVDLPPSSGRMALGRPTADGSALAEDLSRWSVTAPGTGEASAGRLIVNYRIAGNETTLQPAPPGAAAVPAYVDRTTARLARGGVLSLGLGEGQRISLRVVATGDTFPTTRRRFAVLDRATLAAALDAVTPGAGTPSETWVWAPAGRPTQSTVRALQREPYDQLGLAVRWNIERSLRTDPVAMAASRLLLGTGLAGLLIGALCVILLVVAERREAAGELFAREAEGSRPGALRRSLFARAGAVVALGVPFGVVAGLVLARTTAALVTVTAAGTTPGHRSSWPPPLQTSPAGSRPSCYWDSAGPGWWLPSPFAGRFRSCPRRTSDEQRRRNPSRGGAMSAAVDVRDLFCLYRGAGGDVAALRGLSLLVESGERVVVHGPNGSGKTTLLRVLLGEQLPSAGLVHVRGAGIGYIEQHPARVLRPEITVLDNVALQLWLGGSRRSEARAQASRVLDRLGLAVLGKRRPGTLSGGEAQRVGVAAAIAHEPGLVLADEPTGALDRETADSVYELLSEAVTSTGAALLVVSHDAGAGRIADRVVRIRDGRVSEQWHPGQTDETLVVDERGWVRLPEPMRRATGTLAGAVASVHDGNIRLIGSGPAADAAGKHDRGARVARSTPDRAVAASAIGVRIARGGRTVLDGFQLTVPAGALTVVQGRSGSGKSTALRTLAGLDHPDAGRIEVGGTGLAGLDRNALADLRRGAVAYMGQSAHLAEGLDVAETVQVARAIRGLPSDDAEVDKWLAALDLDGLRGRPVRLLSGGERQRVTMARALAVQADLVLADEPSAHLDEAHAELLSSALVAAAASGAAVVAASHDPVLVAAADQVVALS